MLRSEIPAQDALLFVIGARDSEHVQSIVAGTCIVVGPGNWKGAFASIDDFEGQAFVSAARDSEIEPPACLCLFIAVQFGEEQIIQGICRSRISFLTGSGSCHLQVRNNLSVTAQ